MTFETASFVLKSHDRFKGKPGKYILDTIH
jgi:hypothetical protein